MIFFFFFLLITNYFRTQNFHGRLKKDSITETTRQGTRTQQSSGEGEWVTEAGREREVFWKEARRKRTERKGKGREQKEKEEQGDSRHDATQMQQNKTHEHTQHIATITKTCNTTLEQHFTTTHTTQQHNNNNNNNNTQRNNHNNNNNNNTQQHTQHHTPTPLPLPSTPPPLPLSSLSLFSPSPSPPPLSLSLSPLVRFFFDFIVNKDIISFFFFFLMEDLERVLKENARVVKCGNCHSLGFFFFS